MDECIASEQGAWHGTGRWLTIAWPVFLFSSFLLAAFVLLVFFFHKICPPLGMLLGGLGWVDLNLCLPLTHTLFYLSI
jgi:hypothetical protein